jgi:hypothetical protein
VNAIDRRTAIDVDVGQRALNSSGVGEPRTERPTQRRAARVFEGQGLRIRTKFEQQIGQVRRAGRRVELQPLDAIEGGAVQQRCVHRSGRACVNEFGGALQQALQSMEVAAADGLDRCCEERMRELVMFHRAKRAVATQPQQ